jgi:hypothetical protein
VEKSLYIRQLSSFCDLSCNLPSWSFWLPPAFCYLHLCSTKKACVLVPSCCVANHPQTSWIEWALLGDSCVTTVKQWLELKLSEAYLGEATHVIVTHMFRAPCSWSLSWQQVGWTSYATAQFSKKQVQKVLELLTTRPRTGRASLLPYARTPQRTHMCSYHYIVQLKCGGGYYQWIPSQAVWTSSLQTMRQNKHLCLGSCLPQIFHYSFEKLTNIVVFKPWNLVFCYSSPSGLQCHHQRIIHMWETLKKNYD